MFLINAFLNECPYLVVYRIEVCCIGRPRVWCEVRNFVSHARQLGALVKVKVSHQQLDRCMAATV